MYNLEKVSKNLYRGSAPLSKADIEMLIKKWGIKRIISLDEQIANNIQPFCEELHIDQLLIPIDVNDNSANSLMEINLKKLFGNGPTFVHCKHGKDRTGLLIALWRIQNGWTFKKAFNEAKKFGFGIGLSKSTIKNYCKLMMEMESRTKDSNFIDGPDKEEFQRYNRDNLSGWFSAAPYDNLGKFYPLDKVYKDQESQIGGRNSLEPNIPERFKHQINQLPQNGEISPLNNVPLGPIIFMTGPLANS